MKFILLFLLFNFSLFSQKLYLLPDEYNNVIYKLKKEIENAENSILIITDKFYNYTIKNALIQTAKKGVKITLISANEDMKSILAIYKNIETKSIKPIDSPTMKGEIAMSLIIIDSSLTCKLSNALNTKQMQHDISMLTCKESIEDTRLIQNLIEPLIKRSTSYLKD
jgi:uncharacterized protein (UPF0262 family)